MSPERDLQESIEYEAARWLARGRLDALSEDERAEFLRWCAADPCNGTTYEAMAVTLEDVRGLQSLSQLEPGRFPQSTRRSALAAGALAAAVAVIAVLPAVSARDQIRASTLVGEVRPITLEDGTRVTLGGKSEIKIRFDGEQRRVELVSGEAFFEIAEDTARPFVVTAGGTVIHDIGTKFDVKRTQNNVQVGVLEGAVEVRPASFLSRDTVRRLDAGERVRGRAVGLGPIVARTELGDKERASETPGSWRTGQLSYDDTTLAAVITDLNRYYLPGVKLEAAHLGDTRLAAAFKVDEIDKFFTELPSVAPVVVHREEDGSVVIAPRERDRS